MIAGIDVGFGWTKVVTERGDEIKFPTWIAYYTSSPISELAVIRYGGRDYVVGKDVKYEAQKIEISGIRELITYFPVFVKYAELVTGEKFESIITGLPAVYRAYSDELEAAVRDTGISCGVLPQGLGIFLDVRDRITSEDAFILDVGFNTLDYLIVENEGGTWRKKKGNTIEKLGVVRAVEIFRAAIPDQVSYARNFSFSRLLEVFERGTIWFEGESVDLRSVRDTALREYAELVKTRIREEVGQYLGDARSVVFAGGGANVISKTDLFGPGSHVLVPPRPEFSQARGYLRFAMGVERI
ncbi:MAG: ParM/StbA family protein [Thermofilum sp.]